jgi:hypothetical protein
MERRKKMWNVLVEELGLREEKVSQRGQLPDGYSGVYSIMTNIVR